LRDELGLGDCDGGVVGWGPAAVYGSYLEGCGDGVREGEEL